MRSNGPTRAARNLLWSEVEAEIEAFPSLAHYTDDFKSTLLMELAGALSIAIVAGSRFGLTTLPELRLLLQLGADPNLYAESGATPLQWAITHNRLEHAELLLTLGADPYRRSIDYEPETAFDVAGRCHATEAQGLLRRWEAARMARRHDDD